MVPWLPAPGILHERGPRMVPSSLDRPQTPYRGRRPRPCVALKPQSPTGTEGTLTPSARPHGSPKGQHVRLKSPPWPLPCALGQVAYPLLALVSLFITRAWFPTADGKNK